MSFITEIFSNISQEDYLTAVNSGFLLSAAVSVYYIFFGRLFSLPEILSSFLKSPTSQSSRKSLIIISGFIFISALCKNLYHEHLSNFYPFDDESYLKNISAMRLIVSGLLVGIGSQFAIRGRENSGIFGIPTFSLRSLVQFIIVFGTIILTVTYQVNQWIPKTPKVIEIINNTLPNNISFDAYLLVTLLIPFICFLISSKKSLKGLFESILHFAIGITIGTVILMLQLSQIKTTLAYFRYYKGWTGQILLTLAIASFLFSIAFAIVKYAFKKPLFASSLHDTNSKISGKLVFGCFLVGLGIGLGGITLETFLTTIPSSTLRIIAFWGVPYIFSAKTIELMQQRSTIPSEQKTN